MNWAGPSSPRGVRSFLFSDRNFPMEFASSYPEFEQKLLFRIKHQRRAEDKRKGAMKSFKRNSITIPLCFSMCLTFEGFELCLTEHLCSPHLLLCRFHQGFLKCTVRRGTTCLKERPKAKSK